MTGLVILIVIVSSIWVYFDAKNIGIKKGQIDGIANMGPVGWLVTCLGIWILAFPVYLAKREQFKRVNQARGLSPTSPTALTNPTQNQGWDEELRKLAKLREEGLITDEEFAAKKKTLLQI